MRRSLALLLLLLVALTGVAAACGEDEEADAPAAQAQETAAPAEEVGCEQAAQPEPRPEEEREAPDAELEPDATHVATVLTSCGEFEITLDVERAPQTAASFASLARDGFYDGLTFHRISPGFVIQGGDPQGDGTGGPGYSVEEAPPEDLAYEKGVVAMAKAGDEPPGTSGSQFFVVTAEETPLPPEYALVGEVTAGIDVVDRIASVPVDGEQPRSPVLIRQVEIEER